MQPIPMIVWLALGGLLLGIGLYAWLWRAATGGRRFPDWLLFRPRRAAPWTFAELLLSFGLYLTLQMAGAMLAAQLWTSANDQTQAPSLALSLLGAAVGSLMAMLISATAIALRTSATAEELGWFARQGFWNDVKLGATAYLLLAPPVFGVQTFLALITRPSQHPLITSLQQSPNLGLFLAACFVAVVAAPLVEEYLFRGLLQGWLEQVGGRRMVARSFPAGGQPPPAAAGEPSRTDNPYEPPNPVAADAADQATIEANTTSFSDHTPWWPIGVSALLFALVHVRPDLDPDFVALFLLALGLGYLYRQTHRLAPCIVVHVLLNGTSMILLGLSIWWGDVVS